jgi:hypothetical protein
MYFIFIIFNTTKVKYSLLTHKFFVALINYFFGFLRKQADYFFGFLAKMAIYFFG